MYIYVKTVLSDSIIKFFVCYRIYSLLLNFLYISLFYFNILNLFGQSTSDTK